VISITSYINALYFSNWSCVHGERSFQGVSMAMHALVKVLCILIVYQSPLITVREAIIKFH
jgi:uncharacterized membrane protein